MRDYMLYLFFCIWVVLCVADDIGNANNYVDEVLTNLRQDPWIMSHLEPLEIPDVNETNFKISKGKIKGLSSLYRHGDCTLEYDGKVVTVTAEIAVRDVQVEIKYKAKALFFWIKGHATVTVEHLAVKMVIHGEEGRAKLHSFIVVHLGEYKIKKITGMSVVLNWMLKLIANSVAKNSKSKIIDAMEDGVATAIRDLLDQYQLPKLGE